MDTKHLELAGIATIWELERVARLAGVSPADIILRSASVPEP